MDVLMFCSIKEKIPVFTPVCLCVAFVCVDRCLSKTNANLVDNVFSSFRGVCDLAELCHIHEP